MTSKKKEGPSAALTNLYGELNTLGQDDDYERIVKVANKSEYAMFGSFSASPESEHLDTL